jgi:hypothetical protein
MRKIRAKTQGVSEAELIFQSAMPSVVKAAFLIHKESGLVIAETQADWRATTGSRNDRRYAHGDPQFCK